MSEQFPGGHGAPKTLCERTRAGIKDFGPWNLAPALSGFLFIAIFCFFAEGLNPRRGFEWSVVRTNLDQMVTNSVEQYDTLDTRYTTTFTNTVASTNRLLITKAVIVTNGLAFTNTTVVSNTFVTTNQVGTNALLTSRSVMGTNTLLAAPQIKTDRLTRELSFRLVWGVSCVAFAVLCVSVFVLSIRLVCKIRKKATARAVACLGIVVALLYWGLSSWGLISLNAGNASDQLLHAMRSLPKSNETTLRDDFKAVVPRIEILVNFLSAATVLALTAVAGAACCLLHAMEQATKKLLAGDSKESLNEFKPCTETGQDLMGLTAIALVAGTIEVYLLFSLATQHVHLRLLADVQHYAAAIATVAGLIYSGMLIAIFAPLVAGGRAYGKTITRHLAEQAKTAEANAAAGDATQANVAQQLQAEGQEAKEAALIEPTWQKIVKGIITALAPVLAAFLAKLVAVLMELL